MNLKNYKSINSYYTMYIKRDNMVEIVKFVYALIIFVFPFFFAINVDGKLFFYHLLIF